MGRRFACLLLVLLLGPRCAFAQGRLVARIDVLPQELPALVYGVVPITDFDLHPELDSRAKPLDEPRLWVTNEGLHVDREAFAWDARGRPMLYRVALPVLSASKERADFLEIREAPSAGKRAVDGWATLAVPPVWLFVRTTDESEYRADLAPAVPSTSAVWRNDSRHWTRLEPVGGKPATDDADALLGVHSYVSERADGLTLFDVRLSNGTVNADGSGAQGDVYFEDLWVEVPDGMSLVWDATGGSQWSGKSEPAFDRAGRAGLVSVADGPYVFDVRRQTVRRFALCKPGDERRAARVLRGSGYGRAEGPCSFLQGQWGSRNDRIPDFDRPPLRAAFARGSLRGWRAADALGLQKCEKLVRDLAQDRPRGQTRTRSLGLFRPPGSTDRGEAGGWLIESTPGAGIVSGSWMRYHRLMAGLVAERAPTNFEPATGEALTPARIAEAHGGQFPFEVHLTGYRWQDKHELPFWKDAPPRGTPMEVGSLEKLSNYAPIDAEHYVRNFLNAYCWALMTGDGLALDLVRESAARLRQEWTLTPTDATGWWRDLSLGARLARAEEEPGQGTYSTRDFAWLTENVVAAFRLTSPARSAERAELASWMHAAARWITLIETPSGVCEARHARRDGERWFSYYAPDPFQNGISHEWAVGQWLEENLRVNACASLAEHLTDTDLRTELRANIKRTVNTMLEGMRELERTSPPKWVGVKPGTNEVLHHDYGSESFQSQSAMWIGNVERRRIYRMHGDGTPQKYVSEICRITLTEAPEMLSHAAQAVAELVNVRE